MFIASNKKVLSIQTQRTKKKKKKEKVPKRDCLLILRQLFALRCLKVEHNAISNVMFLSVRFIDLYIVWFHLIIIMRCNPYG